MSAHTPNSNMSQLGCAHTPVLPPALTYSGLGWSVVPASTVKKKPRGRWRQYQRQRADESTLREWFADADAGNVGLAIVCGKVSGGLLVRDFDRRASYEAWQRDNRSLARTLPTVETARGAHVYFRCEGYPISARGTFLHTFADGELRGDGNIVVAPPSIHPVSRKPYRWLNGPALPPIVDLEVFGIPPQSGSVTQDMLCNTSAASAPARPPACLGVGCDGSAGLLSGQSQTDRPTDPILGAISETLPSGPGQRNRKLFEFARLMRVQFPDATADELQPQLWAWFSAALPVITTKDFAVTQREFAAALKQVKFPSGGSIQAAFAAATTNPLPSEALRYKTPGVRLLVALCYQLQLQHRGGRPFYLACRDAAQVLGIGGENPHMTAWRWLAKLCHDRVLAKVSSGMLVAKRANEYRYLSMRGQPDPVFDQEGNDG